MLSQPVSTELRVLSRHGLEPLLFGGWAKELHGAWSYGPHDDLDLLVVVDDLARVDDCIRALGREPVPEKRHVHKRAYRWAGMLVEIFQVEASDEGFSTHCYGHHRHRWQRPLWQEIDTWRVVTADNIRSYERDYHHVERAFYQAHPEVHDEIRRLYGDTRMPYHKYFRLPVEDS